VAKVAAATGALLVDKDIGAAYRAADNAVENNDLFPHWNWEHEQAQREVLDQAGENLRELADVGIPMMKEVCDKLREYNQQYAAIQQELGQPLANPLNYVPGNPVGHLVVGMIPETVGEAALFAPGLVGKGVGAIVVIGQLGGNVVKFVPRAMRGFGKGSVDISRIYAYKAAEVGKLHEVFPHQLMAANRNLPFVNPAVPEGITLTLEFKAGMNLRDFNRKVSALQDLAERGKLAKAAVVRDRKITDVYRQNLINRAERMWRQSEPERVDAILRLMQKRQVDHLQDLQIMGADSLSNLGMLDSRVNMSLGSQIAQQLKKFPEGTKIMKIEVKSAK